MYKDNEDDVFDTVAGTLLASDIDASPVQCYMQLKALGRLPEDVALYFAHALLL